MVKQNIANNKLPFGFGICYSGYREGQDPRKNLFPSKEQILEDLKILEGQWDYLRLYDSSTHAERVLSTIREHNLPFKVMLGVDLAAESSNEQCPWGAWFSQEQLAENKFSNDANFESTIRMANRYPEEVVAISLGNEAVVDWTDHLVSVKRLVEFALRAKSECKQLITYSDNYVPWCHQLQPLVPLLDFISVHTYPVWEHHTVQNAMAFTKQNVDQVFDCHPEAQIVVTEAGWATKTNGHAIAFDNAGEKNQQKYVYDLLKWSANSDTVVFVFEAFDEPWKGSEHPDEPEKHWGLYLENREPKPVVSKIIPLFKKI